MSVNLNPNTPFDNAYPKNGLASAGPVIPASVPETPAPDSPSPEVAPAAPTPESPSLDITDVSGAGSRVYQFAEKDISFGARLNETGKTTAAQATQGVTLETDDPAHLGAAKMLSEEGLAAYQDGDFEAAALFYEAACDYDQKSPVLAYNLACAYQKMGDGPAAQAMFETAKSLDPLNRELAQRIEARAPFV